MKARTASFSSITDLFRPNNPKGLRSRDLSSTRLDILKREIHTDIHMIPLKSVYEQLGTDPVQGLPRARAKELLFYYGPNTLTPASQNGWLRVLFTSMCTGFSILIWFGALLCLLAYLMESSSKANASKDNLYLGCVLIGVDCICGLFSFYQNFKSTKIMKTFNNMIPLNTTCVRDGAINSDTPVRDIVKGDIVHVKAGDVIPADIRVIHSKGFKVDNSSLTGECVAVSRGNFEGTSNILESPNVAFFSTMCVEGWAIGVVMCCGDLTALGRVAGLAARLQPAPSPLSREISRFMRYVSAWALCLGIFIAGASLAMGYPFMQTTIFVIGIIVANVPEGLQPTITASLTLTAQHMVKKNCLIKNLEAIEAMGACTTICSDKTGTLTENKMCVQHVWMANQTYAVADPEISGLTMKLGIHLDLTSFVVEVNKQIRFSTKCSSTAIVKKGGGIIGDASETALLNFLGKFDDMSALRKKYPKVAEIPFTSASKHQSHLLPIEPSYNTAGSTSSAMPNMLTYLISCLVENCLLLHYVKYRTNISIHQNTGSSSYLLVMKGAPEFVLSRCATIALERENGALTKSLTETIDKATETLANTGERILAFADLSLDPKKYPIGYNFNTEEINFPTDQLRFLGIMGLMDPPRREVHNSIQRVRAAGVRVMMVTGDHPVTARAIALEVGIATSPQCHVVTGSELRGMTPQLLTRTLEKHYEIVFARTSPTQKLQIVEACQRAGDVVAVTGDGVNDAPALRRADIGISMGITGSQVSKQTADIILMDDNFTTLVCGIEEGRKIFDNLKKSVCYILISNVPEILPVLLFILFSIPLPLGVMTILCIDLGTDMWPAVALSYEKAESDVMARPPRVSDPLVSARMLRLVYGHLGLVEFFAGMFAYFVVMASHGFYPADLFGIRSQWDNEAISDLKDSLGQEWTYAERKEVERACQAAYFVSVVITQMMNGIICKTRYNSLFHVGMKNNVLNAGLVFELILSCIICYVPGVNDFFRTYPLRWMWWFLPLPFALFMFVFDEFRKRCIRRESFDGWYNKLTYY